MQTPQVPRQVTLWERLLFFMALVLLPGAAGAEPPAASSIVNFRKELGLSDAQVKSIQQVMDDFRKQAGELDAKVKATVAQVNADLTAHADLPVVKTHLKAWYDARFELHYADLACGRRLEGLLTKEQIERWRNLQAEARKKASKSQ